jgi:hypothetical protein
MDSHRADYEAFFRRACIDAALNRRRRYQEQTSALRNWLRCEIGLPQKKESENEHENRQETHPTGIDLPHD